MPHKKRNHVWFVLQIVKSTPLSILLADCKYAKQFTDGEKENRTVVGRLDKHEKIEKASGGFRLFVRCTDDDLLQRIW